MRFIAALAILATCQTVYGQSSKAMDVAAFNAFVGTIVNIENKLLAPLAPFGRKLQQSGPILDNLVTKGNAIGSIFYTPGNFFNPTLIGEAITGIPAGRKLSQYVKSPGADGNPDPYGFTKGANMVASILTGNAGRKLAETVETPKEVQWDVEAIHNALGFGGKEQTRKLQQDTIGANYLGSVVSGGIVVADEIFHKPYAYTGRKLQDYRIGYGFPQGTGSKTVQDNALASIADHSASIYNPINGRKAVLGFQQEEQTGRH